MVLTELPEVLEDAAQVGLVAPFPWYGAKRAIADEVWARFGDVDHYIEPFAGTLSVLLARPGPLRPSAAETVNDADCLLANFWRAVKADPGAVAEAADWPVTEADLHARHLWLANRGREIAGRVTWDPDFYDAKVAGWWVWGLSAWVGGGWCSGAGPWTPESLGLAYGGTAGVHKRLPAVGDNAGKGVHAPCRRGRLGEVMAALAERLRYVRVLSGDWSRVLSPGVAGSKAFATTGVLVDPPYADSAQVGRFYAVGDPGVASAAADWALAAADSYPGMRIAFCCYAGSAVWERFAAVGWAEHRWQSRGGRGEVNSANAKRETVWFSPSCLGPRSPRLFDDRLIRPATERRP
jgi:DNA adenine methylase